MTPPDFEPSRTDPLGKAFGPYRLVRLLGAGGMAEAYEAIRRGPSGFAQRVCLKVVLPFFRDDPDFRALFEREAKLAAKLRHNNIVGILDFGEVASTPYIALELVDGADLEVVLCAQHAKRLPHELVALIGHDLAAALDHAHNPPRESGFDGSSVGPIIHRDISPSNVMISRCGEVLLTDFGVAKAIAGTSRKQSAVKGKIPYMSPEQLRAEPLDGRADLFALGVVLFEALAGQRPYQGVHDPDTMMRILRGEHLPLPTLAPAAPPRLCEVIESLIDPDREQRPRNAAALGDLLDEFIPSLRTRRDLGKVVTSVRPQDSSILADYRIALGSASTEPGSGPVRKAGKIGASSSGLVPNAAWSASADDPARDSLPGETPPHPQSAERERPKARRRTKVARYGLIVGLLLLLIGAAAGGFVYVEHQRQTKAWRIVHHPWVPSSHRD